ncbi:ATP-binding protein [Aliiglaciecola sp. LCG003]|uniref:hybrid sensor histidine kinase/response regulator n=1 Tax=Aliiglaciecola sp. LCG003 TaxID=3053655 RepID=UPI0025733BC2|nr:ATP-binding protein [Aliiglaciecola sp. LCG003]WJG10884.1 ATP-binding protein [Aliiglaciecola sp. LCG003]
MSTQNVIDQAQGQSLIDLFKHPVMVVDEIGNLVSLNKAFCQDTLLMNETDSLLKQAKPLLFGDQELVYWHLGSSEKLLTAMPMAHGRSLIKIASSKPSALAKRYHNLVSAIDQMSDAIIICDHDGMIDLTNEQFQTIFPIVRDAVEEDMNVLGIITKIVQYIFPQELRLQQKVFRLLRKKHNCKESFSASFTLPNGQFYQYRDSITLSSERIGLFINESKFKELNEQLESAFQEATELSKAKSNFMAAMSHEVRTPLNAIIGLVDLCMLDQIFSSHEYIKRMRQSAASLLRLVNDVLDFTKFDAQKVELLTTRTNLRKLCESIIENFSGQAKTRDIDLMLFLDPKLPKEVRVDDVRLDQVLSNLISNGLKFNQNPQPTLMLQVTQNELTGYCEFSVKDNGIGIAKSEQTAIFARFSQANQSIHRLYGGTGIGLSICHKICQLMKGDIYVNSNLGEGSEFIVQLPLEACGPCELTDLVIPKAGDRIVSSNDRGFHQVLTMYAEILQFSTQYYEALPHTLKEHEIFCINPQILQQNDDYQHLSQSQMALIKDTIDEHDQTKYIEVHRTPLRLEELMLLLNGRQKAQQIEDAIFIAPIQPSSTIRALVVEDNEDNMYVLKRQFETLKIEANFAMSAEDGMIFFEQQHFDLVISDFQMPGVSGAELISILRECEQAENRSPATMIILTADKTQRCRDECLAAGADKILMKPLILKELSSLIKHYCESIKKSDTIPASASTTKVTSTTANAVIIDSDFFIDESEFEEDLTEYDNDAVIDLNCLYEIAGKLDKNEETQYLRQFAINLNKVFAEMNMAANTQNWLVLGKLAHSLKSSSMIVGARQLSLYCEKLEAQCNAELTSEDILSLWITTRSLIDELINYLTEQYK